MKDNHGPLVSLNHHYIHHNTKQINMTDTNKFTCEASRDKQRFGMGDGFKALEFSRP